MKEQITAKAYAKSILELANENNVDIAKEFTTLTEVINSANDLETVLFLDVFTIEEKVNVLKEVTSKIGLSKLSTNFLLFLTDEKRLGLLPLIYKEIIVLDDDKKGFLKGVIEGTEDAISDEEKSLLTSYLKNKLGRDTNLEYKKNGNLTAGYRVTVEDLMLDATVDNQLDKFKSSILGE